jgi:hypothetical protein
MGLGRVGLDVVLGMSTGTGLSCTNRDCWLKSELVQLGTGLCCKLPTSTPTSESEPESKPLDEERDRMDGVVRWVDGLGGPDWNMSLGLGGTDVDCSPGLEETGKLCEGGECGPGFSSLVF